MWNLLDRINKFLRNNKQKDFKNADDFAEQLLDELKETLEKSWTGRLAIRAIRRIVESTYRFFRLKDVTPFGDKSPVKLKFGGPDKRSVKFLGDLDHFYFSKFADNRSEQLKKFLREEYLDKGNAIFGSKSTRELEEFRKAVGDKLKNITDSQLESAIHTSVQRIRIWGHIGSMSQARVKQAKIVAILDERTSDICEELDGKIINIGVAQKAIERLNKLEPGEFAAEMYETKIGKAISKEPVKTVKKFLEEDGKTISDDLVKTGRGFPPYHPRCRSRLAAIIKGIDEDA